LIEKETKMTGKTPQSDKAAQQRQVAQAIAVVGAIFTLVFLGLMIVNGYQLYVSVPRLEAALTIRKQQLLQQPDNETLINSIREQDRSIRANKLRRLDYAGLAGLMLLISAAITIGALKWQARLEGIAPEPSSDNDEPYQRRRLGESRISLPVFVVLLAGMAILLGQRIPTGWVNQVETGTLAEADYATPEELAENWHRFRGFAGAGITSLTDIPTRWDGANGTGILWKTQIPLPGHNSPVVWEDRIFISGASWEKREVYCFDASSGNILWTGAVPTAPGGAVPDVTEGTGLAASTMATDGVRVYAIFATGDLAAFDFNGRLLWHKSLGIPENSYGHATSLEVWQDHLLVQYDQAYVADGKSHLYSFDGATGSIVWETKRPVDNSWTSPFVGRVGNDYQLITVAAPLVITYNPDDGKEIWRAECVGGELAASPILSGNLVIAIEQYQKNVAIRTGGTGNVTDTHIVWSNEDVGPTIVSPVTDGRRVFLMDSYGTLYVVNALDGKLIYKHDFDENVNSSPTLVAGMLYVLSVNGNMFIGTAGETEYTLEAKSPLGEKCYASPAFMPGRIYIRGTTHLYCIGNEEP
jgi:outer membrane protein assembly factor BamB